jgi:hypothetical protein
LGKGHGAVLGSELQGIDGVVSFPGKLRRFIYKYLPA